MFTSTHKFSIGIAVGLIGCALLFSAQSIHAQQDDNLCFVVLGQELFIPPGDLEPEAEDGTFIGNAVSADQATFSSFTVKNMQATPLTISDIQVLGHDTEGFYLVDDELEFPITVAPQSEFTYQIGFAPAVTGLQLGQVVLETSCGDYPYAVTGTGLLPDGRLPDGVLTDGQIDPDFEGDADAFSPSLLRSIAALNSAVGLGGGRGFTPRSNFNLDGDGTGSETDDTVSPPSSPSFTE